MNACNAPRLESLLLSGCCSQVLMAWTALVQLLIVRVCSGARCCVCVCVCVCYGERRHLGVSSCSLTHPTGYCTHSLTDLEEGVAGGMDADAGCTENAVGFEVFVENNVGGLAACPSCCQCARGGGLRVRGGVDGYALTYLCALIRWSYLCA